MKTAILILTLAAGAAGQYLPCIVDVSPPGFNATMRVNLPGANPRPMRVHQPQWQSRPADTSFWNVNAGSAQDVYLLMPADGTCTGSFESADNRADLTKVVTDAAGRYTHIKPPPQRGDIELFAVDEYGWQLFAAGRNYKMFASTGRSTGGEFSFDLPAGYYHLVMNNLFGTFGSKWVRLTIGNGPPIQGTPGPVTITPDRP